MINDESFGKAVDFDWYGGKFDDDVDNSDDCDETEA
jgi:hypothetical protein